MGKRLFVGNLSFDPTGRSRGFGLVETSSSGETQAAIAALNGRELHGQTLNISEAKERPGGDADPRRGGQPGRRGY
jgi:RNA recognition motif-containing protein